MKWKTVVKSQQNSMYQKEDAKAQNQNYKICRRWLWPGINPETAKLDGFFSHKSDHNLAVCLGVVKGDKKRIFWTISFYLTFLLA